MRIIKASLLAAALFGIALPAVAATYSAPATLTNGSFYTFTDGQVAQNASSFNDTYNFSIGSGVTGVNFLFNLAFPGSSSTTFGVTVGSDGTFSGLTGGNVTSVVSYDRRGWANAQLHHSRQGAIQLEGLGFHRHRRQERHRCRRFRLALCQHAKLLADRLGRSGTGHVGHARRRPRHARRRRASPVAKPIRGNAMTSKPALSPLALALAACLVAPGAMAASTLTFSPTQQDAFVTVTDQGLFRRYFS